MLFDLNAYNEVSDFIKKNARKPVKIIAISKNYPLSSVEKAIKLGISIFGENRVQEAIQKFNKLKIENPQIELHLTGPLQTNKVKSALTIFDVFQTLDREKLAIEFTKHLNLVQNKIFFIQINTGKENSKSGIFPENAKEFINFCKFDLCLPISGLMCIPPKNENPKEHFKIIKNILRTSNLTFLSMGMSDDYRDGIMAGATHIRIGTKFFGKRNEN